MTLLIHLPAGAPPDAGQESWPALLRSPDGAATLELAGKSYSLGRRLGLLVPQARLASPGLERFLLRPDRLPEARAILAVPIQALLDELLAIARAAGTLRSDAPYDQAIFEVLVRQLEKTRADPFTVPVPADPRGLRLLAALRAAGGLKRDLAELARASGASRRTLERIVLNELGMSFSRWRQLVRIQCALALLEKGVPVGEVALEVGYGSSSAFISAFRQHLGEPPSRFLRGRAAGAGGDFGDSDEPIGGAAKPARPSPSDNDP